MLDGHDGHAVQAPGALGAELRGPLVVHPGQPGSEHRILDGGHAQTEAREQDHLVDPVGVGVGEHAVHGPGIDPRGGGETVLRWTPRSRTLVLGVGPTLDEDAELGVGPQRHLIGKALQQLGEELQRLHRVGVRVHDVQVRRHHLSISFTRSSRLGTVHAAGPRRRRRSRFSPPRRPPWRGRPRSRRRARCAG